MTTIDNDNGTLCGYTGKLVLFMKKYYYECCKLTRRRVCSLTRRSPPAGTDRKKKKTLKQSRETEISSISL